MNFWIIQGFEQPGVRSLLFILASGFSLIFGLMRIVNLSHGALFHARRLCRRLSGISAGATISGSRSLIGGGVVGAFWRPSSSVSSCAGWPASRWRRCW